MSLAVGQCGLSLCGTGSGRLVALEPTDLSIQSEMQLPSASLTSCRATAVVAVDERCQDGTPHGDGTESFVAADSSGTLHVVRM